MSYKDIKFKLRWWVKEHLLFYHNYLGDERELRYELPDGYGDFVVHPCVRYVPDAIGGHKWWMVFTPYSGYDVKQENILLYFGEDEEECRPPVKWSFAKEVRGVHDHGYNSDPCLFYEAGELWVVWREWETENLPDGTPLCCTVCSKTIDGISFSPQMVIAHNYYRRDGYKGDTAMCPIVVKYGNEICLYGSVYTYEPYLHPEGTSLYKYNNGFFSLVECFGYDTSLFDLWHFDLIELNGALYQIVTGQFGNAIYIGRSLDGKGFTYSSRPLFCCPFFVKKNYFYKPTAQVVGNRLYVFFPRKRRNGKLKIVERSMSLDVFFEKFKFLDERT